MYTERLALIDTFVIVRAIYSVIEGVKCGDGRRKCIIRNIRECAYGKSIENRGGRRRVRICYGSSCMLYIHRNDTERYSLIFD